jgi:hypothetical protein
MADPDMTATEQNEVVDGIKDQEVRVETRKRLSDARSEQKRIKAEEKKEKDTNDLNEFRRTLDRTLYAGMSLEAEKEARAYYRTVVSGTPRSTNVIVYQQLRKLILEGRDVNLELNFSDLDDTDYKDLARLQQLPPGDPDLTSAQGLAKDIENALIASDVPMGVGIKKTKIQIRLADMIQREVTAYELANGKMLNPAERKNVIKNMLIEHRTKGTSFFGFDQEVEMDDVIKDIPEGTLRVIEAELRDLNAPINTKSIYEWYRDYYAK